jgi:UDP-2-acetamido-2,6-beta-L-arabino-hexul-4-ose reductase
VVKKRVLVTGASGFIGKNLCMGLEKRKDIETIAFDIHNEEAELVTIIPKVDFIIHLAGVNRPSDPKDFMKVNLGFTEMIISMLDGLGVSIPILLSSSIQAEMDSEYGRSKLLAEKKVAAYGQKSNAPYFIFRLHNVFGKWCRPNYNSVVATFCHNIARGLEISVSEEEKEIKLIYIDDVVEAFIRSIDCKTATMKKICYVEPIYTITLGKLAQTIRSFKEIRETKRIPDFSDMLTKRLFSTYLSYIDDKELDYKVEMKRDQRGWLFELLKSQQAGQIFVSSSFPGITRGNHYHDSKVEKFCLLKGKARVRLRRIDTNKVISYKLDENRIRVVDIPPGYSHSIENISDEPMIVLFWANEPFNADKPDTFQREVLL